MTKHRMENGRPRSRQWIWLLAVLLLAGGGYWYASRAQTKGEDKAKAAARAFKVSVAVTPAKRQDVGVYLSGLGNVVPLNTVTVKSRVDGQLMEVGVKEGQHVQEGQLLAQIDPRPFQAQLTQAEGLLARDQAQLQNAKVDLARYKNLSTKDVIPEQQYDTQGALVRQLEGAVKNDQGQIDNAKLQLVYCRITAPVTGRVGLRLVDPGNIVHASDAGGLFVITQMQPITVVFTIPEDSLPPVLAKLRAGETLPVTAFDREQRRALAEGVVLTVDNQIDPGTGTLKLKAQFKNEDESLFPNQFVNVRMRIDVIKDALVVPAPAVQQGPQGAFVYVVRPDSTAGVVPVKVGETTGGLTVVRSGLAEGDQVVVEGADRLREGAPVEVKDQGGEPARQGA